MSDVKQQILDEMAGNIEPPCNWGDEADRWESLAFSKCLKIISKHLEGMAIVPVEPDKEMLSAGDYWYGGDADQIFDAMIRSFTERS